VASEQDAARDRVLAARAAFDDSLTHLEASGRAAIDIPARIRQSPVKAAAIAGGLAFVLLRGPQRLFGAIRRAIFGKGAPLPTRMLPKEIEKTLKSMGDDGEKVRGTLERDFAAYVKKSQRERKGLYSVVLFGLARPMLGRAARRAGEYLFSPSPEGYTTRLDEVRARAEAKIEEARASAERTAEASRERAERAAEASRERAERAAETAKQRADRAAEAAKQRVEQVRGSGPREDEGESPTGI
jgi:pyruvate/2-oxoglutarate dehydrogenase complex dihydrolipoamide acyltransferase (E2) component